MLTVHIYSYAGLTMKTIDLFEMPTAVNDEKEELLALLRVTDQRINRKVHLCEQSNTIDLPDRLEHRLSHLKYLIDTLAGKYDFEVYEESELWTDESAQDYILKPLMANESEFKLVVGKLMQCYEEASHGTNK